MSNIQNILDRLEKKYPLSESIEYKRNAPFILRVPKLDLTLPIHTSSLIYYLLDLINKYNTDHQDNPIKITEIGRVVNIEKLGYGTMAVINHIDVIGLGEIMNNFIDIASEENTYKKHTFVYLNRYHISSETKDTAISEFQDFEVYLKYKLPENIKLLTSVVKEDKFNKAYIMSIMFSGIWDTPEEAEKLSEILESTISDVIGALHHIDFQCPKKSNYL